MRTLGVWVLVIGFIWFFIAVNLDTSVVTNSGNRVNNFGLIADKLNHLLMAAFAIVCGLMMVLFGKKKERETGINRRELADDEIKCPYCAEFIKSEAIKCKHCGSCLTAQNTVSRLNTENNVLGGASTSQQENNPLMTPPAQSIITTPKPLEQLNKVKPSIGTLFKWALLMVILAIYGVTLWVKFR